MTDPTLTVIRSVRDSQTDRQFVELDRLLSTQQIVRLGVNAEHVPGLREVRPAERGPSSLPGPPASGDRRESDAGNEGKQ
jgi:hypothetical protein